MKRLIQAMIRWNVIVTGVAMALGCAGFALVGGRTDPAVLALIAGGTYVTLGLGTLSAFYAGYRLVFLLPNLLLADWPDRDADRQAGIHTVANQLPPRQFVRVCRATCLTAITLGAWLWAHRVLPSWALAETGTPLAFLWILSRPLPPSRLFYSTAADALLAWPGIVTTLTLLNHF